jgi:hypothetical protein
MLLLPAKRAELLITLIRSIVGLLKFHSMLNTPELGGTSSRKTYSIAVNVAQSVYSAIILSGWLPEKPIQELVDVLKDKVAEIIAANAI